VSPVRRLFGGSEPGSIYEHVRRHLREDGPGLLEGGETLPDEAFLEGDLRWSPGALEGAFSRYAEGSGDVEPRIAELHQALVQFADKPGRRQRARLRRLFRADDARSVLDPLLQRLESYPPGDQEMLYQGLRTLLLESGYRGEVKFALGLVGAFGDPADADIFRTLARHEEFTLYGAVALAQVVENPEPDWLELLQRVDGWGKTELAELVMRDPTPDARAALLRHGLGVGNALDLAVGCRLHEALEGEVDDELLRGARGILDALTWAPMGPEDLSDYPEAGITVTRFLELLQSRAETLDDFITAYELRSFVQPDGNGEADGFDPESVSRVEELADAIIRRPEWEERARRALESEDEQERSGGIQVAKRLDLPLAGYLVEQIERSPFDSGLWFEYVFGADEARIEEAIALAGRVWDLDSIATGPALELFGPPPEASPHQAFDFLLQELPNFPGKGWPLVRAALRSPVIRHRHKALLVLSGWPGGLDSEREAAVRAVLSDPDEEVQEDARKVLAGEKIDPPTIDLDSEH